VVGANGGFLSKYSVGVYASEATPWRGFDSKPLQAEIDAWPAPTLTQSYSGRATVETYTIDYAGTAPHGTVVARTPSGERLAAAVEDAALVKRMIAEEPLGASVTVASADGKSAVTAFEPA
jgi:acetyl-CoA C-acetyltransferase